MESKLNKKALQEYCNGYCDALATEFFKDKNSITGQEILELNEIKQINLFIIYRILELWNDEAKKLESPFFNHGHSDVKVALKVYMNTLSQYIEIKKEEFMPLLRSATEETILLICSPYEFYTKWAKSEGSVLLATCKSFSKYVKINRSLFLSYVDRLENAGKTSYTADEAVEHLNHLFEETSISPDDIDSYTKILSKTMEFPQDRIYGIEEETSTTMSSVSAKEENSIKTLNDQHTTEEKSLLDGIQKKKIESIKSHLSINQKFIFINQLFNGSTQDFNSVIDFLDQCSSQSEAMEFINNNFLKKKSWKKDNLEVEAFIEVVARRYA